MFHPKWGQNSSGNSVTFDAKKRKRNPNDELSGNTITETKAFARLKKFAW